MTQDFDTIAETVRRRNGASERIAEHKAAIRASMRLAELRKGLDKTQNELAASMSTTQENVSRIERSTNPYLTTLEHYIESMGGTLEINAVFDDRVIPLTVTTKPSSR